MNRIGNKTLPRAELGKEARAGSCRHLAVAVMPRGLSVQKWLPRVDYRLSVNEQFPRVALGNDKATIKV